MTNTKKFSEFVDGGIFPEGITAVGLSGGLNTKWITTTQFLEPGTTAERPLSPVNGDIRYNTSLNQYEFYDAGILDWVQLESSGDIAALITRLAAHTAGDGASMIGLEDQGSVLNKTVQDLAEADFVVKSDVSSLVNGFALSSLTSGLMVVTNGTGDILSRLITGTTNKTVVTNGDGISGDINVTIADNLVIDGNESVRIPTGTVAQRPVGMEGDLRYNTDTDTLEYYDGNTLTWQTIGSSSGTIPAIGSSTDNALVRWNGTGGNAIQNSNIVIDDSDNLVNSSTTPSFTWGASSPYTNSAWSIALGSNFLTLSDVNTDSNSKNCRIGLQHYTNAEEPMILIFGNTTSTTNILSLGGGTGVGNSATQIDFFTGANNTTLTGTRRGRIDGANFLWNTTDSATNLNFLVVNSTGGFVGASSNTTNSTDKVSGFCTPHYTNAEEPVAAIRGSNSSTTNIVDIGGGTSVANAATAVRIFAAANNATLTGTQIANYNISGYQLGSGSRVTTILNEDDMVSDSDTALATQQSIKAYVDAQVGVSGAVVQQVRTSFSTYTSTTNNIPWDDTIPQQTEGAELMTLSITPTDASNILLFEAVVIHYNQSASVRTVALFQDAVADAIYANGDGMPASFTNSTPLIFNMVAGTTSSTTFKIRYGSNSDTTYINGNQTARRLGGVQGTYFTITEVKP